MSKSLSDSLYLSLYDAVLGLNQCYHRRGKYRVFLRHMGFNEDGISLFQLFYRGEPFSGVMSAVDLKDWIYLRRVYHEVEYLLGEIDRRLDGGSQQTFL